MPTGKQENDILQYPAILKSKIDSVAVPFYAKPSYGNHV